MNPSISSELADHLICMGMSHRGDRRIRHVGFLHVQSMVLTWDKPLRGYLEGTGVWQQLIPLSLLSTHLLLAEPNVCVLGGRMNSCHSKQHLGNSYPRCYIHLKIPSLATIAPLPILTPQHPHLKALKPMKRLPWQLPVVGEHHTVLCSYSRGTVIKASDTLAPNCFSMVSRPQTRRSLF